MDQNNQDIIASLKSAESIAVLLPENPQRQVVAAGLGLYLALKNQGQNVEIACPSQMTVKVNRLVGVNKIRTKLPGRNLVISFDYVKDAIEKVSYNVDDGRFNLVVQPKPGHQPLSSDNVSYSLADPSVSLIILVGSTSLKSAQKALSQLDEDSSQTLSLVASNDKTLINETFQLIRNAQLPLDQDTAGNLLQGLTAETKQFRRARAADFKIAAELVEAKDTSQEIKIETRPQPKAEEPKDKWVGPPRIYRSSPAQRGSGRV